MARVSRKKKEPGIVLKKQIFSTALYVRLSREDNLKGDSYSIENQILLLKEYVANHSELQVFKIYIDNGFSGTNFMRDEFKKMIDDIQAGSVNCVVTKDLSRLGRNYIEVGNFIEKVCPFLGVRFIAVNDNFDSDYINPSVGMHMAIKNIFNDMYARDISKKLVTVLKEKRLRGEYIGSYAPYGYLKNPENKNHLIVDSKTAPIVQQIFEWRAEGKSYTAIAKELNSADISSPSRYRFENGIKTNLQKKGLDILWGRHMITIILNNIVYLGHTAQGKQSSSYYKGIPNHKVAESEWDVVYNTHTPIISEELFQKVKEMNNERKEKVKSTWNKYDFLPKKKSLYGNKLLCAECGCIMKIYRNIGSRKDKVWFTYICPTHSSYGVSRCHRKSIPMKQLDDSILSSIKGHIQTFLDKERIVKEKMEKEKQSIDDIYTKYHNRDVDKEIKKLKQLLLTAYTDMKDGILSNEEYIAVKQDTQQKISRLEGENIAYENIIKEQSNTERKQQIFSSIQKFYNAAELTKEMVDAFISEIKVHSDNTITITFIYDDVWENLSEICTVMEE